MSIFLVLVLLGTGLPVQSEIHSLHYIYMVLSRPVGLPGIHQFTAVGFLDEKMIEYYDSENQTKIPKQDWMRDNLTADYWERRTQFCKSKQQWFKVNIDDLMDQMRQNKSDLHVLQRMRGCEGEKQPDGSLKFHRGINKYAYDGDDFLSFDDKKGVWYAHTEAAIPTKRKWDHDQELKEYTKAYPENKCMDWLNKLMTYAEEQLKKTSPPEVFMFAKKDKVETNLNLTCFATGFYAKGIILRIKRNGRVLTKEDGLKSSGVVPNGDKTFQRRDHIEILKSDLSEFSCEVIHEKTGVPIRKEWVNGKDQHHEGSGGNGGVNGGGVVGGLIVVGIIIAVVVVVLRNRQNTGSRNSSASSDSRRSPVTSDGGTTVTNGANGSNGSVTGSVDSGDSGLSSATGSDNQNQPTEVHVLLPEEGSQDSSQDASG